MRARTVLLLVFVILDVLVVVGKRIELQRGAPPVIVSAPAPDFSWNDFDGNSHRFSELKGHTVVLHFWGTWCGPCRTEFPQLLKASTVLDKSVVILTISSDIDKMQALAFIRRAEQKAGVLNPPNVLYAFDPERVIIYTLFQSALYPETILIDAAGTMRRKFAGTMNWEDPAVRDYVKQVQ